MDQEARLTVRLLKGIVFVADKTNGGEADIRVPGKLRSE